MTLTFSTFCTSVLSVLLVECYVRRWHTFWHGLNVDVVASTLYHTVYNLCVEADCLLCPFIIVIFYLPKKSRRATRKAEAHHTLVAHYIMIVNVRIKTYNTHINLETFKASIP